MIESALQRFRELASPGPYRYQWCHHHAGKNSAVPHIEFGCLIHGNEHGTLPAAVRLVEALTSGRLASDSAVTVLLGNVAAARADRRFLEEDFNRVFTFDRPAKSAERRLAELVRPILDDASVFLDLHQTQTPTARPFWTFPWEPTLAAWARALRVAPFALTRPAGQVFSKGTCCLDEYVRNRGRVGITVELGYRGPDDAQVRLAEQAMTRAVLLANELAQGAVNVLELAEREPPLCTFETAHVVAAPSALHRLRPGLENWTPVRAGELLSADGAPELRAPQEGYVLFPKYPRASEPPPPELYRLAREVTYSGDA